MSRKLNLVNRLLTLGRNYQDIGRDQDALHVLGQLSGFRELPADVAEETQARLAEIQFQSGRYPQARRHLAVALLYRPTSARYLYLMARAFDTDEEGDWRRAARYYRQSLRIDPHQPDCLSDYGLLALRRGRTAAALKALRKAAKLDPEDPEVLDKLVEGLCLADRPEEALAVLRAARFRNARDHRFHDLWNDFQFDQLSREQEAERQRAAQRPMEGEAPMLLPFLRPPTSRPKSPEGARIRLDAASPLQPPHSPRPSRLSNRKHAQ